MSGKVTLKWHGMLCPNCHEDHRLHVSFAGICWLTEEGSEDCGDHEWDHDSECVCGCGFGGEVHLFSHWGSEGDEIDFAFWPEEEDEGSPSSFEIQVYGMAGDADGEGLASEMGVPPSSWEIELKRYTLCAGGRVDVLIAYEASTVQEADSIAFLLEGRFPMAERAENV